MTNLQTFKNDESLYGKATTLLQISGGQDSTYVAWRWLTDHPDEILFLHHINLSHSLENRLAEENRAVGNILTYFRNNGLSNFIYFESDFAYGNLPRISIKDIQVCALFAGIIFRTPVFENVKTLLLSWHEGEVDRVDINRGFRVKAMLKALEVDGIDIQFPIINTTRRQMADEMPPELLRLVHTCRKPIYGRSCGKCKTCLEMKEAGIWRR